MRYLFLFNFNLYNFIWNTIILTVLFFPCNINYHRSMYVFTNRELYSELYNRIILLCSHVNCSVVYLKNEGNDDSIRIIGESYYSDHTIDLYNAFTYNKIMSILMDLMTSYITIAAKVFFCPTMTIILLWCDFKI